MNVTSDELSWRFDVFWYGVFCTEDVSEERMNMHEKVLIMRYGILDWSLFWSNRLQSVLRTMQIEWISCAVIFNKHYLRHSVPKLRMWNHNTPSITSVIKEGKNRKSSVQLLISFSSLSVVHFQTSKRQFSQMLKSVKRNSTSSSVRVQVQVCCFRIQYNASSYNAPKKSRLLFSYNAILRTTRQIIKHRNFCI